MNALTYIDVKDSTPTAMAMGWSWVVKTAGRAAVFTRVEDRVVEMAYSQEQVRGDLFWTQVLLTTYTFLPFSPPSGVDREVEQVMVDWYLDAPDELISPLWKPEVAQSFQDILDHIEAEYAEMVEKWETGGKKGKEPGYPARLVKKIDTLHQHLVDMGNPVPWSEVDRWAAERWFARKGSTRPLRMSEGEALPAYLERLKTHRKGLVDAGKEAGSDEVKAVDRALAGLGELLNTGEGKFKSRLEGEKDTRAVLKGRDWLDERCPRSSYGIHNTLRALLAREQVVVQGAMTERVCSRSRGHGGRVRPHGAAGMVADGRSPRPAVELKAGRREGRGDPGRGRWRKGKTGLHGRLAQPPVAPWCARRPSRPAAHHEGEDPLLGADQRRIASG